MGAWGDAVSASTPSLNSYWNHRVTGIGYRVEALANERSDGPDFPLTITLCRLHDGALCAFPAAKWSANFKVDKENTL